MGRQAKAPDSLAASEFAGERSGAGEAFAPTRVDRKVVEAHASPADQEFVAWLQRTSGHPDAASPDLVHVPVLAAGRGSRDSSLRTAVRLPGAAALVFRSLTPKLHGVD